MNQQYFEYVDEISEIFYPIAELMQKPATAKSLGDLLKEYEHLVQSNAFSVFINAVVKKSITTPDFSPIWISGTEAPIVASEHAVLSLKYHDSLCSQSSIYGVPSDIYFTLLSCTAPVTMTVYSIDPATYQLNFNKTLTLSVNESVHLKKFETFKIETNGVACFSRLLLGLGESTHVFDADTLQYLSMLSLNPVSSRWYFMARIAAQLDEQSAITILKELTKNPSYDVRWVALQELFNFDTNIALSVLDKFRNDPHPFVAEKASSEWDRIQLLMAS